MNNGGHKMEKFAQDCGWSVAPFRRDAARFNRDRHNKRVILNIYDAVKPGMKWGQPCNTPLDLPPANPRFRHPPKKIATQNL